MDHSEVIIIGGGPAGLSAALILGRCRRHVLIYDNEAYRNAYSHALHGFLSRDGIDPAELRQIGRDQLTPYDTVKLIKEKIIHIEKIKNGFIVKEENGHRIKAKIVLLATGICDIWPTVKGASDMYGLSIFHCPYCDGWEMRDQPLALFGRGDEKGGEAALALLQWSKNVVLCTQGPALLSEHFKHLLSKHSIPIREEPVVELIGHQGILKTIIFESGLPLDRRAIFFNSQNPQHSQLPAMLGCQIDREGSVTIGKFESTNVPGLFVAGDASHDVLQAIIAAGAGVEAAMAINSSLINDFLNNG